MPNGQHIVVQGASHDLITEALHLVAPLLVEFMFGDPFAPVSDSPLAIPYILDPILIAPSAIVNWTGEYFANRELLGEPTLVRVDPSINFDWGEGSPAQEIPPDNFSVRWTAEQEMPAGTYRFSAWVDDGVRLWINDVLVLDHWNEGPPRNFAVDVNLVRGLHRFRVEYFEATGGALARLFSGQFQFYQDWQAEYFDGPEPMGEPAVVRSEREINYFWGDEAPAPGVPAEGWSARWTRREAVDAGAYTFEVDVSGLVRIWLDGALLIDDWQDRGPRSLEMTSGTLTAGEHSMRVEYARGSGDARLLVQWRRVQEVQVLPTAVIEGPARALVGQQVTYAGGSSTGSPGSQIVEHIWSMGDGSEAAGVLVQHVYAAPGVYNVTLRVTDDQGLSSSSTLQVRVDQTAPTPEPATPPQAVIVAPTFGYVYEPLIFDASQSAGANPIVSFAWRFGDGTVANAVRVAKTYGAEGTYNVTLTVTDDQGLSDTTNRLVQVLRPASTPAASPTPTVPVAPSPTLSPTPTPTSSPTPVPTGTAAPAPTPTPLPTSTPQPGATPVAVISGPTSGLVGQELAYDAAQSAASGPVVRYEWNFGDGTAGEGVAVTKIYGAAGPYTLFLVITDSEGQQAASSLDVVISDAPVPPTPDVTPTIPPQTPTPTATMPAPAPTPTWTLGPEPATPVPSPTVGEPEPPTAIIAGPTAAAVGEIVSFDGSGSEPGSSSITIYAWEMGDGTSTVGATTAHQYAAAGVYVVSLTVTDDGGSSHTAEMTISVSGAGE
jgi:PKD repeat protein